MAKHTLTQDLLSVSKDDRRLVLQELVRDLYLGDEIWVEDPGGKTSTVIATVRGNFHLMTLEANFSATREHLELLREISDLSSAVSFLPLPGVPVEEEKGEELVEAGVYTREIPMKPVPPVALTSPESLVGEEDPVVEGGSFWTLKSGSRHIEYQGSGGSVGLVSREDADLPKEFAEVSKMMGAQSLLRGFAVRMLLFWAHVLEWLTEGEEFRRARHFRQGVESTWVS